MAIKLEVGKYYKNKSGAVVGPLKKDDNTTDTMCFYIEKGVDKLWWNSEGQFYPHDESDLDLVEEVPALFKLQEGKYYELRNGDIVGPLKRAKESYPYVFYTDDDTSWTEEGQFHLDKEGLYDIVKEVIDFAERYSIPIQTIEDPNLTNEFILQSGNSYQVGKMTIELPKSDKLSPGIEQIPFCALERIGAIFAEGEPKYGRDNWKKDPGNVEYNRERLRHAIRHLHLYAEGDTSEDHLAKVAWFCVTTIWRLDNAAQSRTIE